MKRAIIQLSLQLFNAVPQGKASKISQKNSLKYGVFIDEKAAYATTAILDYFAKNKLSGEQLNATFHKSWKTIKNSSRETLLLHQILHYCTTYGSNFKSDFIYIPVEELQIPELKQLPIRVIRGVEKQELLDKCLAMLSSGVALGEDTVDQLLELLGLLGYRFTSVDTIKNKEALVKIIAKTGIYPTQPTEFLRYLVYLATDSTLLIKSPLVMEAIKEKRLNITAHLRHYGLEKCATIFNRFKPIWLAFKANKANVTFINKISKLSKTLHQPMPVDVLNTLTSQVYSKEEVKAALKKVNNFRKVRLLYALNTRLSFANAYLYKIRNGKSFAKMGTTKLEWTYFEEMYQLIYQDLVDSLAVKGMRIKYPGFIDYALPASEKMFVGNVPVGTKITARKLVSGVYWENAWGARDLDLSALSLSGKVGWNDAYQGQGLLYSGDMTDAKNGATELLYTDSKIVEPSLSQLNIYNGEVNCKFKMVIGQADKIEQNYTFNPNELLLEVETSMKSKQQILGLFMPEKDNKMSFTLVNTGLGNISVSGRSENSDNARNALYFQYVCPISFRQLLQDAGAILVEKEGEIDLDLSPQQLQKDTLMNLVASLN
ncbi:MAG: hypothetical protein AAGJ18_10140 [Bacteroidota bacterium]